MAIKIIIQYSINSRVKNKKRERDMLSNKLWFFQWVSFFQLLSLLYFSLFLFSWCVFDSSISNQCPLWCEHVPFTLSSSPSNSSFVLSSPSRICPFISLVFSSKFYTHQHVLYWNRAARDPAWGHDRDRRAYCEGQHSRILRARSRSLAGLGPVITYEAASPKVRHHLELDLG